MTTHLSLHSRNPQTLSPTEAAAETVTHAETPLSPARAEREALASECARLAQEWATTASQLKELQARHVGLYDEAQRLRQERDVFRAEAERLAREWATLSARATGTGTTHAELERQRAQIGSLAAECESQRVECKRLSNEWAALADELRACRRSLDIAQGENLIVSTRVRELERRLAERAADAERITRQPLYRFLRRLGVLRAMDARDGGVR